jgi:hypothetical protein
MTRTLFRKPSSVAKIRAVLLLDGWYEVEIAEGVDLDRPGIYEWIIEGAGRYIGKYTHISRPFKEYKLTSSKY